VLFVVVLGLAHPLLDLALALLDEAHLAHVLI
jgi:hypothetical protein